MILIGLWSVMWTILIGPWSLAWKMKWRKCYALLMQQLTRSDVACWRSKRCHVLLMWHIVDIAGWLVLMSGDACLRSWLVNPLCVRWITRTLWTMLGPFKSTRPGPLHWVKLPTLWRHTGNHSVWATFCPLFWLDLEQPVMCWVHALPDTPTKKIH